MKNRKCALAITAALTMAAGSLEATAATAPGVAAGHASKPLRAGSYVAPTPSAVGLAAKAKSTEPGYTPAAGITAGQIVDRNIAARGGLAAWRAVETLAYTGSLEAGGKDNTALPFVMKLKRAHKSRLELTVKHMTAVQVYDGTQGWKLRPYLNRTDVEPYTPAETKSAAAWEELDGPLVDYAAKGTTVKLLGMQEIEGAKTYVLQLTGKSGVGRRLWIDAKSFLEKKIDGEARKLDGRMHEVAIFYRDYKTENGLQVPRVQETVVEGVKGTHKMTFDKVVVNAPMDDSLFGKPAGVPAIADSSAAK
ncbi:MAG: outer membrane lipoprotein-sorting protein [Gammaproteobacteria bacterium]|nr:outer membrane lipoprotein-sorting protein [Gammaproteobacteria bacterium]